jgi:hypothetical protein
MTRTLIITLSILFTLAFTGVLTAQTVCPMGYWPVGNGMCCPIGSVPVMGPYGAMQCSR